MYVSGEIADLSFNLSVNFIKFLAQRCRRGVEDECDREFSLTKKLPHSCRG